MEEWWPDPSHLWSLGRYDVRMTRYDVLWRQSETMRAHRPGAKARWRGFQVEFARRHTWHVFVTLRSVSSGRSGRRPGWTVHIGMPSEFFDTVCGESPSRSKAGKLQPEL